MIFGKRIKNIRKIYHFCIFHINYYETMTIHKEGYPTLVLTAILFGLSSFLIFKYVPQLGYPGLAIFIILWLFLVSFFRNPNRRLNKLNPGVINCPADGKIVVIEETMEEEYFNEKRLLVSIFMSPLNVHVNRNPISGKVLYSKYHPGKYLAAWNPKSSTLNERTTVVYESEQGHKILMRQIAGALARRIVNYLKDEDKVTQGDDMGFIKLGSRVDLYLPIDTQLNVKIDDTVYGNKTVIGKFS